MIMWEMEKKKKKGNPSHTELISLSLAAPASIHNHYWIGDAGLN